MLKLLVGRPQDLADVHALLKAGADIGAIKSFLARHAPDLAPLLAKAAE